MKTIMMVPLLALTAGCMAQAPREASAEAQTRLAAEIDGRVAGPTVNCVSSRDLGDHRSVGQEAIIFGGRRGTIYVNRPLGGCPVLRSGDAMRIRTPSTRLCSGDIVTIFDPLNGTESGGCALGSFTPYRRAD